MTHDSNDRLSQAIEEGRSSASYLWQVPDDADTRRRMEKLLHVIRQESSRSGRREMPSICEKLLVALRASPSPQQVDILQDGFDRLHKLCMAAKSGMMTGPIVERS